MPRPVLSTEDLVLLEAVMGQYGDRRDIYTTHTTKTNRRRAAALASRFEALLKREKGVKG